MMKKAFTLCGLFMALLATAAEVDTVVIRSEAMKRDIRCVVIKPSPAGGDTTRSWPAVYLLHGYDGSYNNWIRKVPDLKKYADELQLYIVCPDGGKSSWYFDSPVDPSMKYETYIGKEVPAYMEAHYPLRKNRQSRAVTGLSMGGHGGLFLGFRHADFFGACGSMSGGVDLNGSRTKYDIARRIGDTVNHINNWKDYSVVNVIEKKPADSLAIIIDCGTEDFFYSINHSLHEKMLRLHIAHDYIERPGKHDWNYWGNAIEYQLIFFSNFFNRK